MLGWTPIARADASLDLAARDAAQDKFREKPMLHNFQQVEDKPVGSTCVKQTGTPTSRDETCCESWILIAEPSLATSSRSVSHLQTSFDN